MATSELPAPMVIVVEDDASLRHALRFSLEIDGFQVIDCESGEALLALELPAGHACLVIDERLEGVNGLGALEDLRERGVRLPAILITSIASDDLRVRAARDDATVVEKPLLTDALVATIRQHIAIADAAERGARMI